jgi:hypothetical protein
MDEVTLTGLRLLKIWWAFAWRMLLLSMVIGFGLAMLFAPVGVAIGFSYAAVDRFMQFVFAVVEILVPLLVLPWLFSLRWSGFRIAIVSSAQETSESRTNSSAS